MRVDSLQFRMVRSSISAVVGFVALLTLRPPIDLSPTLRISVALLSTIALVPYLLGGIAIVLALITAACAIAMAVIVFRIESARMQFIGENPRDEYTLYPLSLLWKM